MEFMLGLARNARVYHTFDMVASSLKIFSCEGLLWAGVNIFALVLIIIVALNE